MEKNLVLCKQKHLALKTFKRQACYKHFGMKLLLRKHKLNHIGFTTYSITSSYCCFLTSFKSLSLQHLIYKDNFI